MIKQEANCPKCGKGTMRGTLLTKTSKEFIAKCDKCGYARGGYPTVWQAEEAFKSER